MIAMCVCCNIKERERGKGERGRQQLPTIRKRGRFVGAGGGGGMAGKFISNAEPPSHPVVPQREVVRVASGRLESSAEFKQVAVNAGGHKEAEDPFHQFAPVVELCLRSAQMWCRGARRVH